MLKNADCVNGSEFSVLIVIKHDESADEVRQIPVIKVWTQPLVMSVD
jgi:hypothetical protein